MVLLIWPGTARALTDEEIFRDLSFDLTNPGARALGMGGASAAVVDDVTATQANPAGLHFLMERQFQLVVRSSNPDTGSFSSSLGSLQVDPVFGTRDLPYLGLNSVSNPDGSTELGFLAFAWPLTPATAGRRVRIAGSREVMLSEERSLADGGDVTEARFAFESFPNTVNGSTVEAYSVATPVSGGSSTEIVAYSVSGSVEVHRDFSLGLTLSYATLDLQADTLTEVIDPLQLFLDPTHPRLIVSPTTDRYRTRIDDTDSDVAFTFGLHLHPDSVFAGGVSPWRFAAVYHKGYSFSVAETTTLNGIPDQAFETGVVVPDRYGIAASYRANPRWLLSLEIERIEYSDMLRGYRSGVNYLTSGRVAGGAFGIDPTRPVEFAVDDGVVPRFGVEYSFQPGGRADRQLAVWAGYFHTPDHRIRMKRFNSDDPAVNATYLEAFGGGEETDHVTAGVGFSLGRSSFHLAGETSDDGSRLVGGYTFRLGGPKGSGGAAAGAGSGGGAASGGGGR